MKQTVQNLTVAGVSILFALGALSSLAHAKIVAESELAQYCAEEAARKPASTELP